MSAGRPKIDDPRIHQYRLRMNDDEVKALNYICKARNVTVADFFRSVIFNEYEWTVDHKDLFKKEER